MKTALSIAGSDSCGGAGIQADIKTMTMNGVYAMSAITALTAQNTTGVRSIMEVTPEFLKDQINAVFEDVFYAVKTAKDAGFFTVAVEDAASSDKREEIKKITNLYLKDFTDPVLKTI